MKTDFFVCPLCQGLLGQIDQGFTCPACRREYPSIDGIPDFFISPPDGSAGEEDPAWRENLVWLDPQMAEARETIYRLSIRELRGMAFAMQQLARRTFPGCRILEVGTGTGHLARWMAEVSAPGTEIFAFDYSWPMLTKARTNLVDQPQVILLRANALGELPFRAQSFDLVFLRLAPLGGQGTSNVQVAFDLLKPGGDLFKAGWKLKHEEPPWPEAAIQFGYESAEVHQWQYPRTRTREEYEASLVERERLIAFGAPIQPLPTDPETLISTTYENLRIARKPF